MKTIIKHNRCITIHKDGERGIGSTENIKNVIYNLIINNVNNDKQKILVITRSKNMTLYFYNLLIPQLKDYISKRGIILPNSILDEKIGEYHREQNLSIRDGIIKVGNNKIIFRTAESVNPEHFRGWSLNYIFILDIDDDVTKILHKKSFIANVYPCLSSSSGKVFFEFS